MKKLKAAALAATPGEWLYRTDPGNPLWLNAIDVCIDGSAAIKVTEDRKP